MDVTGPMRESARTDRLNKQTLLHQPNDSITPDDNQHEHNVTSSTPSEDRNTTYFQRISKTLLGLAIVIGIAISWVGSTQFASSTYSEDFFAPSFNVWFSTVWMSVCYPVYVVGMCVRNKGFRSRSDFLSVHW